MSKVLCDTPDTKDVKSVPSRAEFTTSTSLNLQTKGSHNNGETEKKCNSEPNHLNHIISSSTQELNDLLNRVHLNSNSEDVNIDRNSTPKKKNARRKQRKRLHVVTNVNGFSEKSDSANISFGTPNGSFHNILANQSNTLLASTSVGTDVYFSTSLNNANNITSTSRYLNNLSHHPQFQYMRNTMDIQQTLNSIAILNRQHTVSAPNTPLIHSNERPGSTSIPCSPLGMPQSNVQFLKNMMQHPLLNHSLNFNHSLSPSSPMQNIQMNSINPQSKKSPKHKKNDTKKSNDKDTNEDKKFENYLSAEEVERGLNNGTLFEGVMRINPKQFQQGFISTDDRDEQDVFIDGVKNRNKALEGDVVIVQLVESIVSPTDKETVDEDVEKKQKRGKVVFIKEKVHPRCVIGHLKLMADKNRQRALFVPRDYRVPRLNIPCTDWPNNFYNDAKKYEDTLFLAQICEWFDTRFAKGKILSIIGYSGEIEAETKAIIAQNDLDITPFGPEVNCFFPQYNYTIPDKEIALREDCRSECIFSIDPFNCRDIDDAISCKELENGNYEVGVHISDVSHYLTENTVLDTKVSQKATTIYLVDKAYHMLPEDLCILCSLFPGVDKLAFSVFWEITKDGQVLRHRFAKTVINSCAQLAYEHAQAILEDKSNADEKFPETYNGYKFKDIQKVVKIFGDLAAKFRKARFEHGALRIDQPKISFSLSTKTGLPESYWIYEIKESNQMIEEFMLLANMTVAKHIYEYNPTLALLRCHPPPSGHMMRALVKSLMPLGIELDISSAGSLHHSLLPHTGSNATNIGKAMVLNMLCAKPMTRAKYFCAAGCEDDDFHHYALNVPLYTHFTSPIRRYADIMVHRLLAASLNYTEKPTWEVDKVRSIAAQCNMKKYNAKRAGEMSSELYLLKYIEIHSPVTTEAVVVEVREKYIDIIIAAMGLNRRIFFNNDFPGEYNCVKHDGGNRMSKMEIKWRAEEGKPEVHQVIEVFSVLTVLMTKAKGEAMIKIETKLIRPDH